MNVWGHFWNLGHLSMSNQLTVKTNLMIRLTTILMFIGLSTLIFAEGTRELAPNSNITINGNNTTDIAALNLDHINYNNFASYNNPNATSRLHIHIADPSSEGIYLGFSWGTLNQSNTTTPTPVDFEYRILDPNGNIIFGPMVITTANANAPTWQEAFNGPAPIYPGGYTPITVDPSDLMSAGWTGKGDYYIEFREIATGTQFLVNYWDITVADVSGATPIEKKGRLWSQNWALFAINDYDFPNRPFNGAFYVCAPDPDDIDAAFITKVDFNGSGFRPAAFNIAFNSFGAINTGNIAADRRSVENLNSTTPEYEIFLNDPVDLCETAEQGNIELIGLTRCTADDFCIKFRTSREGQIDIILDFDGNDGVYTPGTADVLISANVTANQVNEFNCLDWDGKDGLGNFIGNDGSLKVPIVISYAQGIYHFPIFDAELLTEGLTINAVRPTGPQPLLYYDDSNISVLSGSGEPAVQLNGCTLPCHKWTTYTGSTIAGFGNLNTINSWWFSAQVITSAEFPIPAYYTCEILPVDPLCPGDSTSLSVKLALEPSDGEPPVSVEVNWTGPAIVGPADREKINIESPGTYSVDVLWITATGDSCETFCEIIVEEKEETEIRIDTLIQKGDTVVFYSEKYFDGGTYTQVKPGSEECDTLITVVVRLQEAVAHYNFDDCLSAPADSTNQDYSEFEPIYPNALTCADLSAGTLHREMPEVNHHSCTPGVNSTPAMCISSLDTCEYIPGHDKSIVFTINVNPNADTAIAINRLCFFEKGPERYDWINGPSGPNNYPTLYAVRVLKDGIEIFVDQDIPTTTDWTKETFNFTQNPEFTATQPATYQFEILPYCLSSDSIEVAAWDIDELTVFASCASPSSALPEISGLVFDHSGIPLQNAQIQVQTENGYLFKKEKSTSNDGRYVLDALPNQDWLFLSGKKEGDDLNGVSMRDVLKIQNHLFGRVEFDSPFEILAADANGSSSISISDVVEIRKLLLGKKEKFSHRPSWILGHPESELELKSPWNFLDQRSVYLNSAHLRGEHWLAIKTGDVTFDAIPAGQSVPRNSERLHLTFEDRHIESGKVYEMDFLLTENLESFHGLQVEFNNYGMQVLSVDSDILELTSQDYHIQDNTVSIAYGNINATEVSAERAILKIKFKATKNALFSDLITLRNGRIQNEIYSGEAFKPMQLILQRSDQNTVSQSLEVVVFPNPMGQHTTVSVWSPIGQTVTLSLFDLTGKQILNRNYVIHEGHNDIVLSSNEILTEGAVIYRLSSSQHIFAGKLLRKK